MRKKSLELTDEMKSYIKRVTKVFSERRSYRNTYLKVSYEKGVRWYPIKQRFTERYGNMIYAKLRPLQGSVLHSFWTLTTKVDGTLGGFHQVNEKIKRGWADFRSLWSKDVRIDGKVVSKGIKAMDYLRVFELTKNFGMHIHIAIFNAIDEAMMVKLMIYWNKHHGWTKVYSFTGHEIQYERSEVSMIMHKYLSTDGFDYGRTMAWSSESWVTRVNGKYKIVFNEAEWVNAGSIAIKYVYKYMVKMPSIEKRAVLTDNRIRTYSCSKNVNGWLTSLVNDWKEKNSEDLGKVLDVEMDLVPSIEIKKRGDELMQKIKFRWEYSNIVNIMFSLDEEYFNFIDIPTDFRFDGSYAILNVRSDRLVHDATRGIEYHLRASVERYLSDGGGRW